ncbi:MAG: hypothetical protein WBA57_08755 [Elainellaceae cyanobacterium]
MLLLPSHPEFGSHVQSLCAGFWRREAFFQEGVVWCGRSESGLLEPLSGRDVDDYVHGGELEEVEQGWDDAFH